MCLKGLIAATFERSEPLYLLRLMGVSAPSLHRESTDSLKATNIKNDYCVAVNRVVDYSINSYMCKE